MVRFRDSVDEAECTLELNWHVGDLAGIAEAGHRLRHEPGAPSHQIMAAVTDTLRLWTARALLTLSEGWRES